MVPFRQIHRSQKTRPFDEVHEGPLATATAIAPVKVQRVRESNGCCLRRSIDQFQDDGAWPPMDRHRRRAAVGLQGRLIGTVPQITALALRQRRGFISFSVRPLMSPRQFQSCCSGRLPASSMLPTEVLRAPGRASRLSMI